MKRLTLLLWGLAVLMIISGSALLVGQPSTFYAIQPAAEGASVAYSSELVIAVDAGRTVSDVLAGFGVALLVGGLMVSAATIGWRNGRKAVSNE